MILSWLLGCFAGSPPETPSPEPAHSAEVEVVSYREEDISKVKDHPKIHSYITFRFLSGDEALQQHATRGELKVNSNKLKLDWLDLPLTPGQTLSILARPGSEEYVHLVAP